MTILTGLVYPAAGHRHRAGAVSAAGERLARHGRRQGHRLGLIGRTSRRPEYFHPRPSAAGAGYDASLSSGSNFGPTNQKLIDRVKASVEQFRKENPDYTGPIPADAVTASASGLDPHISPANADIQALASRARAARRRRRSPGRG